MLPEERAREKIDRQLKKAGWEIVSREEYTPHSASAVKEGLMQGNTESDYLLFVDDKAIAVVEAKREENPLAEDVQSQAEGYATHPQNWYGLWYDGLIPLVYLANGSKIYFKNLLSPETDYIELTEMHSPKKMLQLIHQISAYGALPCLEKRGLRDCQYRAEMEFENAIKNGKKKSLAVLATGSGKTYRGRERQLLASGHARSGLRRGWRTHSHHRRPERCDYCGVIYYKTRGQEKSCPRAILSNRSDQS